MKKIVWNNIVCVDTKEKVKSYSEYLATTHWKILRVKVANREKHFCQKCGVKVETNYHIHHTTYAHIGCERLDELMLLCSDCHEEIHVALRAKKNNEHKPPHKRKTCSNCYFSQLMTFTGANKRTVLWCNKKLFQCDDNLCTYYRRGAEKQITQKCKKQKKNKLNRKKQKKIKE